MRVRGTSSASNSTTSNVTLTVGSGFAVFTITTKAGSMGGGGGGGGGGSSGNGGGGGGGGASVDVCLG